MDHQLVIDHRDGGYEAHCTCGGLEQGPLPSRVNGLREVYARIRLDHRRHVEAAASRETVLN